MANYAYVNADTKTVEELYDFLPPSWRNVSGLSVATEEDLKHLGFYKVVKELLTWDPAEYKLDNTVYEYDQESDEVIETHVLSPITSQSLTEEQREVRKAWVIDEIRSMRDQLLRESDWTQTVDVVASNSEETNLAWKEYRKALRDMPQNYIDLELMSIAQVVWPNKPAS